MRINMNRTRYSSFDVHMTLHTWTLNLKRNQSPIPTNTNLPPPSHYTTGQRMARKHDTAQGARLRRDKKQAMGLDEADVDRSRKRVILANVQEASSLRVVILF